MSVQVTSGASCKRADYQLHLAPRLSLKYIKASLGNRVSASRQETLGATKLISPPCTEYLQVGQAEGEYAFQAVKQIQHICAASDQEVTAAQNLCPSLQYIFQEGNPSSRSRHSIRTQDARSQLPRISLGQRAACEPGAGTGPGSAEA